MEDQTVNNAATVPKKSHKALIIVLVVVGAVVLLVGGGIALMMTLFSGIMNEGSKEASTFVDTVKTGDYTAAYDYFSPALQEVQSLGTFTTQAKSLNLDGSCKYNPSSSSITNGVKETSGKIDCDSKHFDAEFRFEPVSGIYKLYKYQIAPIASTDNGEKSTSDSNKYASDVDGLKEAFINRSPLNCEVTNLAKNQMMRIQTNSSWSKMRFSTNDEDNTNMLLVKGDGIYVWTDSGAYKMSYDGSYVDTIADSVYGDDGSDIDEYNVTCQNPNSNDFTPPADVSFISYEDM